MIQAHQSTYTVQEAQDDFGPCGKLLFLLQRYADPSDMDMNLLFGLEACWKQHVAYSQHSPEQMSHVAMMQPVFKVSSAIMAPLARKARENAHQINWIERVKDIRI